MLSLITLCYIVPYTGLVRKSFYLTWIANTVLVIKPNGKLRTYVDYTYLNKVFPKDNFSLPRI